LVIAGLSAFALYVVAFEVRCSDAPGAEISLFTTFIQGVGYLMAMALANLCFNFGRWAEALLRPRDPQMFRERAFRLGFWFSLALPFTIPAALFWFGCQ
jgi:hypothetical protein